MLPRQMNVYMNLRDNGEMQVKIDYPLNQSSYFISVGVW